MIPDVSVSLFIGVTVSLSKACEMAMKMFSKKMLKELRIATKNFVLETGRARGKKVEAKAQILNSVIFDSLGSLFRDIEGRNKQPESRRRLLMVESVRGDDSGGGDSGGDDSGGDDSGGDDSGGGDSGGDDSGGGDSGGGSSSSVITGHSDIADGVFGIVGDVLKNKLDDSFKSHWYQLDTIAATHCDASGAELEKNENYLYDNHKNKLEGLKEELSDLQENYNGAFKKAGGLASLDKLDSK